MDGGTMKITSCSKELPQTNISTTMKNKKTDM